MERFVWSHVYIIIFGGISEIRLKSYLIPNVIINMEILDITRLLIYFQIQTAYEYESENKLGVIN